MEASTQTSLERTGRNVYTQTPKKGEFRIEVIVEEEYNKILLGVPRVLTNTRKKAPQKPRMTVSEVNAQ